MGCPCAASLSAARPSPRPPSPTHSFRCKAARRAPLWGPAGQAAPTAGVGVKAQGAELTLANKASEPSNGPLCAGEVIYKHGCASARAAEDQMTTSFTEWEWSWLAVGRASRMAANEAKFGLFVRKVGWGPPIFFFGEPGEPSSGSVRPRGRPLGLPRVWTAPMAVRTESPGWERG